MSGALLCAYDLEVRTVPPTARPGLVTETDGPVRRSLSPRGGLVTYPHLDGLSGTDLDALIARQRDHFAALSRRCDWFSYTHDEPADLRDRLLAPTSSGTRSAPRKTSSGSRTCRARCGTQGRGIYRALVARRAQEAVTRGCEYVVVDPSKDSRPIRQRLGLIPLTTRVTYRWQPQAR